MRVDVWDRRRHLVSVCEPLLDRWCSVPNLHQHAFEQSSIKMLTNWNAYIRATMESHWNVRGWNLCCKFFRTRIVRLAEVELFRKNKRQRCSTFADAIGKFQWIFTIWTFGSICWNLWSNYKKLFHHFWIVYVFLDCLCDLLQFETLMVFFCFGKSFFFLLLLLFISFKCWQYSLNSCRPLFY